MTADAKNISMLVKAFRDFEKAYAEEKHEVSFEEKLKESILMVADLLSRDYRTIQDDSLKAYQRSFLNRFFSNLNCVALSFGVALPNEFEKGGGRFDADE